MLTDLVHLLDHSRSSAARSVNAIMTATYWLIGRRIVEGEQKGKRRAGYEDLRGLDGAHDDLTAAMRDKERIV